MIINDKNIRYRLRNAFPQAFISMNMDLIVYPARNISFMIEDVESEADLIAKILEWLSREASKSLSRVSQEYHLNGINQFLGTDFSQEDMIEIYTYLGNEINHGKTMRFIDSGYDLKVLYEKESA